MRILIIDPQFDDAPDIERQVAGQHADIVVWRTETDGPPSVDELGRCDALINCRSRNAVTRESVAAMTRCRIVCQAGVGFNHIDLIACAERGIPVCNTPDYGTTEVADHAIALALALTRGIVAYDAKLRRRAMGWHAREQTTVRRLTGRTFAIVGLGRIGTATALRARGFGVDVAFYDPLLPPGTERAFGFRRLSSLGEAFAEGDIVSVHTPLTETTAGFIDAEALAKARPGCVLVNTSRGATMDLDAVHDALRDGRLAGAGLDVLPEEPMTYEHPLIQAFERNEDWLDGRLIVTPHAAFFSPEGIADMRRISMQTVVDFLRHGVTRSCVNAALLEAVAARRAAAQ